MGLSVFRPFRCKPFDVIVQKASAFHSVHVNCINCVFIWHFTKYFHSIKPIKEKIIMTQVFIFYRSLPSIKRLSHKRKQYYIHCVLGLTSKICKFGIISLVLIVYVICLKRGELSEFGLNLSFRSKYYQKYCNTCTNVLTEIQIGANYNSKLIVFLAFVDIEIAIFALAHMWMRKKKHKLVHSTNCTQRSNNWATNLLKVVLSNIKISNEIISEHFVLSSLDLVQEMNARTHVDSSRVCTK